MKTGVVFVHGFMGGGKTWENYRGKKFSSLLEHNPAISAEYQFFEFEYFTKISDIFYSAPIQRVLGAMPFLQKWGFKPKVKANRPISHLSELLSGYIRGNLAQFNQVVIIAHSMGGLIAKDYILHHGENGGPKLVGFVSIAVPHNGSLSAAMLAPAMNVNLREMTPLSEYGDLLNKGWHKFTNLPPCIYITAINDECVPKTSAAPITALESEKFMVAHDHLSVCKPEDLEDLNYKLVESFLLSLSYEEKLSKFPTEALGDSEVNYDNEIFVIKLIIGDINSMGIDDAKESFFHAEIISKALNQQDKVKLTDLQTKILSLYRQTYSEHVSKKSPPNQIFSEVHKTLLEQDKRVLDAGVEQINFLHKKGLLQQLANKLNKEVIWCPSTTMEKIKESYK